jgi:hypothetical protein
MRHAILAALAAACFVYDPAVAQTKAPRERAVLFEQDNTPNGTRSDGVTAWSIKNISPSPGEAPEPIIEAVVTIPDRHMTATWSLRRNTDKSLPASHVIEVTLKQARKAPGGDFNQIPGILMKADETSKGTPLAGIAVKVTANFFMLGLSADTTNMRRNVELLQNLGWIDIPVVRNNGYRFILAVQKGASGSRAFDTAFAAWNNVPSAKN